MGVLLIKCPVTGREFSTGLQISANDAPTLPDARSRKRVARIAGEITSGAQARRATLMRCRRVTGSSNSR